MVAGNDDLRPDAGTHGDRVAIIAFGGRGQFGPVAVVQIAAQPDDDGRALLPIAIHGQLRAADPLDVLLQLRDRERNPGFVQRRRDDPPGAVVVLDDLDRRLGVLGVSRRTAAEQAEDSGPQHVLRDVSEDLPSTRWASETLAGAF